MPVKSHYKLWYKTLGKGSIISVLLLGAVLPALFIIYYYLSADKEMAIIHLRNYIQITIPILTLINPATALKAYCERPQKELLLQINRRMRFKVALLTLAPTFFITVITLTVYHFLGMISIDLLVILVISILFQYAVSYTLALALASVSAAVFFLITYAVINIAGGGKLPLFPFFFTEAEISLGENMSAIILYLLCAFSLPVISNKAIYE
ncbi:MAG TPA: hypothetical protein GXX72_05980 [Clostridiaceae bacterium]|nr:hypothetical protein [Clostridiaceae bacterium]